MLRWQQTFYLACALGILLTACAKKDPAPMERPPATVTVASAVSQDVPLYLDEVGHTVAREVVSVQPQVSGKIMEIHFADGANLKKGDLLFTIDPRPFEAQLNEAQANLAQSKAALDFAQVQFARVKDLIESRAIARQDYDTRKNAVDVGQAQVKQNEAAVESARLNLEYTSIQSPIEGRAGHRLVDSGNVVTANTTTLLTIERLDPIYADFTATESDLSLVQRELAKHPLKTEVRLPDQPKPETGQLTFVDNSVQSSSGTVMLRATVPNPARHLWPGQFVNVRLVLANLPKAVLVPAAAAQDSAKGPFVYVVKEDSTAELRPVKLGQRQGEMVVIAQGLQAGEHVVMNGQLGVMPGGKVRVVTNTPTAAQVAPAGQL
ncbi:MAG TPA: efflux RND transporter periplasmic adaptor subunit [Candidatus Acidoferrales bacterium]|jgi:multidrug efflux system membrane fusion protein|nr:efflux RND transporter periplasmic adaptor subunit [Candidatus Acidoferrales bacterium]